MTTQTIAEFIVKTKLHSIQDDLSSSTNASSSLLLANEGSFLGLTELLLKEPNRVDALARNENRQAELIPRFLAISVAAFSFFGLALVLVIQSADHAALPTILARRWAGHPNASAWALWLAYTLGLVAATGVCLPSFYFYGLLAGIKVTVLQVTAQIMKGQSATAMMLMGVLPIYVAIVLGAVIFHFPTEWLRWAIHLGLVLPFVAGLWGVRSMYLGFTSLTDTLPPSRLESRCCFLRRLTVACAGCYTAVAPVMIYKLWDYFATTWGG